MIYYIRFRHSSEPLGDFSLITIENTLARVRKRLRALNIAQVNSWPLYEMGR